MLKLIKILILLTIPTAGFGSAAALIEESNISLISGQKSLSVEKNEIKVTSIFLGNKEMKYKFLIQAGLHGNETLTTSFVHWLKIRIKTGKSPLLKLPKGSLIDLIPESNPDSTGKFRYNKNGINLNRNFGVLWGLSKEPMGNKAFSEPETNAIKNLFRERKYLSSIDIHGYLNWVVLPSDLTSKYKKGSEIYSAWTQLATKHSNILPGYFIKKAVELGDGGAFEDWAFWDQGSMALCLEMRYPFRYFRYQGVERLDSFESYETYIFKMFQESIGLRPQREEFAQPFTELQKLERFGH